MVPDSKSSAEVVPPNGMSRCVCTSMPPGITSLPVASMMRSAGILSDVPIVVIFSPSTKMSPTYLSVAVTIAAFNQDAHTFANIRCSLVGEVSKFSDSLSWGQVSTRLDLTLTSQSLNFET